MQTVSYFLTCKKNDLFLTDFAYCQRTLALSVVHHRRWSRLCTELFSHRFEHRNFTFGTNSSKFLHIKYKVAVIYF